MRTALHAKCAVTIDATYVAGNRDAGVSDYHRMSHHMVKRATKNNVWCAAGKGLFSTSEVVRGVQHAGLANVVEHRRLILPQLSATELKIKIQS